MPVQATIRTPVSSATRFMKRTSRPPNIAVGSTIVCTPRSLAAPTATQRRVELELLVIARGHCAATASSRKRTCSCTSTMPELLCVDRPLHGLNGRHLTLLSVVSAKRLSPAGLLAQLRLEQLAAGVARQRLCAHRDVLGAP